MVAKSSNKQGADAHRWVSQVEKRQHPACFSLHYCHMKEEGCFCHFARMLFRGCLTRKIAFSELLFKQAGWAKVLLPLEIVAHHFIKPDVVRSVEVSQLLDGVSVDLHVSPALGLAQATRRGAALRLLQTGEAFGAVEIEVLVRDDAL